MLEIKNNETPHSPLISTETMPLLQDQKVTDEKKLINNQQMMKN
ncbi:hypothetical protein [Spiroplasma endosymbiont of Tiphia femorata]